MSIHNADKWLVQVEVLVYACLIYPKVETISGNGKVDLYIEQLFFR